MRETLACAYQQLFLTGQVRSVEREDRLFREATFHFTADAITARHRARVDGFVCLDGNGLHF
ncbi:MAG: hypothetical protein ACYDBZ_16050 [Steroidobacteraceae bacterium]